MLSWCSINHWRKKELDGCFWRYSGTNHQYGSKLQIVISGIYPSLSSSAIWPPSQVLSPTDQSFSCPSVLVPCQRKTFDCFLPTFLFYKDWHHMRNLKVYKVFVNPVWDILGSFLVDSANEVCFPLFPSVTSSGSCASSNFSKGSDPKIVPVRTHRKCIQDI